LMIIWLPDGSELSLCKQIIGSDMAQGSKEVSLNFGITAVQPVQQVFDFPTFGRAGAWAGVDEIRKSLTRAEPANQLCVGKSQGPDHSEAVAKQWLTGPHRTDFSRIAHIDEKRLDNVVFVVSQGDLAATQLVGDFKQSLAAQARTKETGIFAVGRAVADDAVIRMFDPNGHLQRLAVLPQRFRKPVLKARIDVNGCQIIAYGCAFPALQQHPKQTQTVFASRQGHKDAVAIGYHLIAVDGSADGPIQ